MATVKADILDAVQQRGIRTIRLQFADILGLAKGVNIPSNRLEQALDSELLFDGSSLLGFTRIEEAEMRLRPDYATFAVLPWPAADQTPSARLICDVHLPDETPFAGDPRQALRKAVRAAEELGFRVTASPECEFFLFARRSGEAPLVPQDRAGYFDMGPSDLGEQARREIVLALEAMGTEVHASHHEVGPGQHEIRFGPTDALTTADRITTLKYVTRRIATQLNLAATFMPKPLFGQPGSGMHTYLSLFDRDGRNAFFATSDADGLSDTARHFIAGLLTHGRALAALTNPLVNSYKRLMPGYEAPCHIAWSLASRSALVRVPPERRQQTRIELRSPDPACNPYLMLTAILAAGLDGIERRLSPPPPVQGADIMAAEMPINLGEALEALAADTCLRAALGEPIASAYLEAKSIEWDVYQGQVHPWELEQYFDVF